MEKVDYSVWGERELIEELEKRDTQDARAEQDKTYNGWSNYPTWRVRLELFDGDVEIPRNASVHEVADYLKEQADEAITGYGERDEGLAIDYARAFLSEVDWYEIAEALMEDQDEDEEETED